VDQNHQIWQTWAETLNRWGVTGLAATFLDALGPLCLFGAQFVYIGQPFLVPFFSEDHLHALADLLENPQETRDFVSVLRQKEASLGS
jgi:hypothetical protein